MPPKRKESAFILALSDIHCGHRYGLMNPETVLEAKDEFRNPYEYKPQLNRIQQYIWKVYTDGIEEVRNLAAGREIIVLVNGDLTTGDKHADELVSDRMADQIIIAKSALSVLMGLPKLKTMRIVKGTGAHNFGFGSSEILIADFLEEGYKKISTMISNHYLLNLAGADIDVAHHGPTPGSRNWLKGNEARYYLRSLMMDELSAARKPPRMVFRGHYHEMIREDVSVDGYTSTIILTPSLTWINDYARQGGRSPSRITHGMVVCEMYDGELLRVHKLTKTIDLRTKEVI